MKDGAQLCAAILSMIPRATVANNEGRSAARFLQASDTRKATRKAGPSAHEIRHIDS